MPTETEGTPGIPGRLQKAREMSGLSRRALSVMAGLAESHVGQLERGVGPKPGAGVLAAICGVLGVSLDWLVLGQGPEPEEEAVLAAVEAARAGASARDTSESLS